MSSPSSTIDWDAIGFLGYDELRTQLSKESSHSDLLVSFLDQHRLEATWPARNDEVKGWLKWCNQQKNRVKVVDQSVPDGILPRRVNGCISDVKVFGGKKGYGPDDYMYNRYADLREKVARGNTVVQFNDLDAGTVYHDNLIFALKKFTGGMGDEDETQPDDNKTWMNYFLKPVAQTERIVCTRKANGEAAHLSVRWIKDRFVLCVGSKNVHMLIRNESDIDKYKDSRYLVARNVAQSVADLLGRLSPVKASLLLSFMHHLHLTAVFEVLQPQYQHVVDLSHLDACTLNFITWTLPYGDEKKASGVGSGDSYCALPPDAALEFAASLGLTCVEHEVVGPEMAEARMDEVRRGYGYEGEVLYFLDSKGRTIGLLKKKTAWYVLCRAVREKVSSALADLRRNPHGTAAAGSTSAKVKKTHERLEVIQKWLGFPEDYLDQWKDLAAGYIYWCVDKFRGDTMDNSRGKFPVLWKEFLAASGKSDEIKWK